MTLENNHIILASNFILSIFSFPFFSPVGSDALFLIDPFHSWTPNCKHLPANGMGENVTGKRIAGLFGDKMPQRKVEVFLSGRRASVNWERGEMGGDWVKGHDSLLFIK